MILKNDSRLQKIIKKEINRQTSGINLIASENWTPKEVLEILGSPLNNKYSEGYPRKRYYSGTKFYDQIELLAQKRALKAFSLSEKKWAVNVQPYSGSTANLAIYLALKEIKGNFKTDILSLDLKNGGHLSHGSKVSFTGKLFKSVFYQVNPKTGLIDFSQIEKLAKKYRPKIIISGFSSYPRKVNFKKFFQIAKKIGAFHLADISHIAGLICAKVHPSPFNFSHLVMTTTHKTLKGPRAAIIFSRKIKVSSQKGKIFLPELINKAVFPGLQGGPHNNKIAALAYALGLAQTKKFKNYQFQILKNAQALAKDLKELGFSLFAQGTDNHLILVDLKPLGISGRSAEKKLEQAGIFTNRNVLPNDASSFNPSGLRLGTPFITALGLKEKQMKDVANFIYQILVKNKSPKKIKKQVLTFTKKYYKLN